MQADTMTDELKHCPFCGSDNLHIICYNANPEFRYQVECRNCEATTSREYSRTLVIERWNTRAEPIGNADELPIRSEVKTFAEFMEVSLKLNDYKGGWRNETPEWLMSRLKDEVQELQAALDFALYNEEKIGECVDVANYAMMIADVLSLRREDAE